MSQKEENNKQVVLNAISVFNKRDLPAYIACHTKDATVWETFFPEPISMEESVKFVPQYWNAFPDVKIDTKNIMCVGNTVVVENIVSGTFKNDFLNNKATNNTFKQREAVFFDIENGKIKMQRVYMDQKALEQQQGILK
jgi:steroid delta-isomerase-like uncharacterized protein